MTLDMNLKVGDDTPDFILLDQNRKEIKLTDLKGKRILLSFHPLAWTGVCAKQMSSLEANFDRFEKLNTIPLGVSVDTIPSKKAWAEHLGIEKTSLISDFWPHGDLAKKFGIFLAEKGISGRVNIIIDENQKISFIKIYDIPELPNIEEILNFLS